MMRKLWKFKAIDKAIRLYMLFKGNPLQVDSDLKTINPRHIVIFSTTALGDFLFNTPAIRAIRERFPEARITLVAHQKFSEFLHVSKDWEHFIPWNNKAITLFGLIQSLKNLPVPDLTLLLHSHEPYDYIAALLAGSKCIIKDNYFDNFSYRDKWLSEYTIGFRGHIIQRKLWLIQSLGCDISNIEMKMPISVTEKCINKTPMIGFQIGASTAERCWSPKNFASVATSLFSIYPTLNIILTGGPGDKNRADDFMSHLPEIYCNRVTNRVGNTTLAELTELLNSLDLLVTGDTGPLHIAVAVKTPTVSLFTTANPFATGPLQNPEIHDIIYISPKKSDLRHAHIMDVIEPSVVIDKINQRLLLIKNTSN